MKAKISLSFFFLLLISNSVFAIHDEFTAYTGTSIWEDYHLLPQAEQWQPYYSEAHEIAEDLNRNGGKYRLEYKIPGGSSHQLWVIRVADGKAVGLWSAPNHATYILGEIFAFHLTRIFSRSQWGTLGVRVDLS